MAEKQTINALYSLYKIVEAGEKGYAVCAANVDNPGLKILFKTYALQRAKFKSEIFAEIQHLDDDAKPRSSLRSIVHRGRIDIFASLIIEREKKERSILKEIKIGEKAALRAYEKTLKQPLSAELRELVSQQFVEVRKVVEQIYLMLGNGGKRMVIQLFDTEKDAAAALKELKKAGFSPDDIQKIMINDLGLYQGRGTTILETVFSGAIGGALWGSLIGALAGIGAGDTSIWIPSVVGTPNGVWAWIALSGIFGGAFVGAVLGLVLGVGITEEDKYVYEQTTNHGRIILLIITDISKTLEARRILSKINLDSRIVAENMPA